MRGWQILLLIVLLSSVVLAQECTDTDGGGAKGSDAALMTKGEVKYGLTTQVDTCLTSEDGVSTASGIWLKEYYCSSNQRMSHEYDCVKYGYDKCQDGECVGGSSSSSSSGTNATPVPQPKNYCGNKIREKDKGEECDPPNSICFGKSTQEYGTCQADCTCKIAQAALENIRDIPPECGDGYKHPDEDCEEDADCSSGHVCSSCKCVKELTPEEIEAMKQAALAKKEQKKEDIAEQIDEEFKAPPLPEVDLTAKNFSDEPAIKATSGFANFFKKIFAWLAGIFS
jgi:hypothetical protein